MILRKKITLAFAVIWSLFSAAALPGADPIKDSLDKAARYLKNRQNPDGGYGPYSEMARVKNASDVGITAIVLYALAVHPRQYRSVDGPLISKAVEYLLSKQQPDGGFYDLRDPVLQNYRTCVVLMALTSLDQVQYAIPIGKARKFIKSLQLDESKGYNPDKHLSYGGNGYGGGGVRPDLSNAGYAAEALYMAGESASSPIWKKLEVFTSRCQNMPEVSPLLKKCGIGTTGDGGFRYSPNDTRGPVESIDGQRVFSSYGSMTYQGLKTLLYAKVSRKDPRVRAAFQWISKHFTVDENPGMASRHNPKAGQQGLYYYYHTMSKALAAYGEPTIVDGRGKKHNWAKELSAALMSRQHEKGYWANEADRWWENLKELDTAFAMISLATCRDELKKQEKQTSSTPEASIPAKKSSSGPRRGS